MSALLMMAGLGSTEPAPDARTIFSRAMVQAHAATVPRFLQYRYAITITHKSKTATYRYEVLERTADSYGRFTGINPDGTLSDDVHLHKVLVSPGLFLGTVRSDDAADGQPRTIGDVVSEPYSVRIEGIEPAGSCAATYKLALLPTASPETHVLRSLWVDTESYRICRAAILRKIDIIAPERVLVDLELDADGYVDRWNLEGTGHFVFGTYTIAADATLSRIAALEEADPKLFR